MTGDFGGAGSPTTVKFRDFPGLKHLAIDAHIIKNCIDPSVLRRFTLAKVDGCKWCCLGSTAGLFFSVDIKDQILLSLCSFPVIAYREMNPFVEFDGVR